MWKLILPCLGIVLLALANCNSADTSYTVYQLPSGREVKVIGITRLSFTKGDPALMLRYRTELRLQDHEQLRKEAEEIWQVFRLDVEQAGLKAAIISAHEPAKRTLMVTKNKSYNFVIQKVATGNWEFLNDSNSGKQPG